MVPVDVVRVESRHLMGDKVDGLGSFGNCFVEFILIKSKGWQGPFTVRICRGKTSRSKARFMIRFLESNVERRLVCRFTEL